MTPVEYIQRCAEMFGVTYDWLLRDRCDEKIPIYMDDMRKGTKFDSGGTDKIFANIDEGISNPGYLTAKK